MMKLNEFLQEGLFNYIESVSSVYSGFKKGINFETEYGNGWVEYDINSDEVILVSIFDRKTKKEFIWSVNSEEYEGYESYSILEVFSDMVERFKPILDGEEYTNLVTIPLDLTDDEFLLIAKAAHTKDITINQYMNEIIEDALKNV